MKRFLLITSVIFLLACTFIALKARQYKQEANRLSINQETLLDSVRLYKTKAGKNAADVQILTLTTKELEKNKGTLTAQISDMGIKLKRAQSLSITGTTTDMQIITDVRDSIVYRDTAFQHVQAISWCDSWTKISGTIYDNVAKLNITSVDTLFQVVHRVPHRFLFFRWGTKKLLQTVSCSNPHTKIVYDEYIKLIQK